MMEAVLKVLEGEFMRSEVDKEYQISALAPDEDRQIILGSHLLMVLEDDIKSSLSKAIVASLDESLTEPHERALFNLAPLLDYGDKVIPFKRR